MKSINKDEVKELFFDLLVSEFCCDRRKITLSSTLTKDLDLDSLRQVELVMLIEDEFDISVPEVDAEKLKTVEDCINYIQRNLH